jgi:transposase
MGFRLTLTDMQWAKISAFLGADRRVGRPGRDDRNFIEAVLWWRRTGAPWRDLPCEFGPWKSVFNRFDRWSKAKKWQRLFEFLRVDRDNEWQSLDSTINRVHQHGSGGSGGAEANAIGRSRGGLSTKVHLVVDALGLPLEFEITEGQRHDSVPASNLVARSEPQCLIADKAYDSDAFRNALAQMNCQVVIPPTANRSRRICYDKVLYKARSEVECTFSLLKQARRFATRYEKTLRNYTAVVAIGCAQLWLRI